MKEYKAWFKFHYAEIQAFYIEDQNKVIYIDPITNEYTDLKNASCPLDEDLFKMQWRELKKRINSLEPDIGLVIQFYNDSVSNLGDWKAEHEIITDVINYLPNLDSEEANIFFKLFLKARKADYETESKIIDDDYIFALISSMDGRIKQNP